jgi:hypothetical protein
VATVARTLQAWVSWIETKTGIRPNPELSDVGQYVKEAGLQ